MAEGYHTEEEQVEALKKWWAENGKSTLVSIVVAIAAVLGWQGYQKQQQARVEEASVMYQNMLTAAHGSNGQPTATQITTANYLAETLKHDFPSSTYAQFAALYRARFAVDANDFATAEQELRWVLNTAAVPAMLIETRLRLARILYAEQKYDEALAQLQGDASGYAASYEEIKGDIYQARGDKAQALAAYQKAIEINNNAEQRATNRLLEIKLEQLTSAMGSTAGKDA